MNDKIADALGEVRDAHIQEAARPKKTKGRVLLRIAAAAAVMALVVGIALLPWPGSVRPSPTFPSLPGFNPVVTAVSLPGESRKPAYPRRDDFATQEAYKTALTAYKAYKNAADSAVSGANAALADFYTRGSAAFVGGQENAIWSPVNVFIGLSMAAELTQGESRQQILDLFGARDIETLRGYASAVWETVYQNDGYEICALANSLWLAEDLSYGQEALDNLAYHYYASVYKGEMGSKKMNSAIGAWLNENTGGLLKNAADNINLSPDTVLALYSTLYLQGKWQEEFSKADNTEGIFHAPTGDRNVTYMNKKLEIMQYYWGDTFGTVSLSLKNGSRMWLILPDEGVSTDDVLSGGQYLRMVSGEWENCGAYKVNLAMPKFDITSERDLKRGLEEMGVTDVFTPGKADFSAITGEVPVFLTGANQVVRVQVDEQGVKAAAYIELPGGTSLQPPDEIVDFILDRPFIFVISSSSVPLFVGTVNEP